MRCLNCRADGIATDETLCPECGVYLPALLRDVLPAATVLHDGAYRLDYPLGRGAFGITYRAVHARFDRPVAIKEFYPQDSVIPDASSARFSVPASRQEAFQRGLRRFIREGQLLFVLYHPNVVRVTDLFEERGTAYLVMEFIQGRTLRDELDACTFHRMSPECVHRVVDQLVAALEAIHAGGVYHLDIKPDNVLLTPEGRVVLVDFGAARQGLGDRGTLAFTMEYAPPEVLMAGEVGPETDLFELGMMTFELLTGKRPPPALERRFGEDWTPVGLEHPWQTLLAQALRLERDQRPHSARQWWSGRLEAAPPQPMPSPDQASEDRRSPPHPSPHRMLVVFWILLCSAVLIAGLVGSAILLWAH